MIVLMENIIIYVGLALVGLCMGSFAGATIWRLRADELADDKANNEDYDKNEYHRLKKLMSTKLSKDRSQCLHCSYQLKWYDLIPLVSWIFLKGKCRSCYKPIGYLEPVIEFGVALFFVLSYAVWPYTLDNGLEIARLILWLASGVGLAMMFAYDIKWFMLPDKVNYSVIGLGIVSATTVIISSSNKVDTLMSLAGSVVILSGLYYLIYKISRGRWIGFGDIKLGLGLALLLADWGLAFVALFAANLVGCLIVIPLMLLKKLKSDSRIPFGPLLIIGAVLAQLVGVFLIDWYTSSLLI